MKYRDAITQILLARMTDDPRTIVLGVGVGDSRYGGTDVFGTLAPVTAAHPDRVFDTPLSETMLTGACVGLAAEGYRPIMVHARIDFMYLCAEHIFNTAASWRMIHGTGCPVTFRAIVGEGWGQGPAHSKAPLEMYAHASGVDLFTPRSRFGLRRAYANAVATGNPTVILERRRFYEAEIEEGDESEPPIDWTIPRGPAPASAPLERAYYAGNVIAPGGGPF